RKRPRGVGRGRGAGGQHPPPLLRRDGVSLSYGGNGGRM
ncbi:hypothetical protein ACHAW5_002336, partial [Stephanodiscus triporus]